MPSPMVTQNKNADRETVISPAMGEAARERGEGEGGFDGGGKKMKCRECERDLPLSAFYVKAGGRILSNDCKLCFRNKQRERDAMRDATDFYDAINDLLPVELFNRRRVA